MEETNINLPEAKAQMGKSFKIAGWGAVLCVASSALDIIGAVKETDSLTNLGVIALIIGLFIWGIGLVSAGNLLCNAGHKETGVISAGGALIFWAIIEAIVLIFVKDEVFIKMGAMAYVWTALSLIGPAIFYFALKQDKEKEDKFFDSAAIGVGIVAICTVVMFVAVLLIMHAASGKGVSVHETSMYTMVQYDKGASIGIWIAEHFKIISIVLASASTLGYVVACGSMFSYNDFLKDIKEEKIQEEKQELLNEVINDYKNNKSAE